MNHLKRLVSSPDYSYLGSPDDPELIFEKLWVISKSSFSTTYKALDKRNDEIVELKIILMDDNSHSKYDNLHIQSFQYIIQLLKSRTKAPHFVSFKGLWLENNQIWIASEFCAGGSIQNIMKTMETPLNEQQICAIIKQILKGLDTIHKYKLIHRSIKSQHIYLDEEGQCKINNLGVSAILDALIGRGKVLMDNPYWSSPELIADSANNKNDNNISCKTDIWSLGITAIEMSCGKAPFLYKTPLQFIWDIPSTDPPKLEDKINNFSKEFHDFVRFCLIKDPSQRPTAGKLLKHAWIKQADQSRQVMQEMVYGLLKKQTIEEKLNINIDSDEDTNKKSFSFSPNVQKKSTMLTDADDEFEQSDASLNCSSIFDRFMPKLKLTNTVSTGYMYGKIKAAKINVKLVIPTQKIKRAVTPTPPTNTKQNCRKYPVTPLILSLKNPDLNVAVTTDDEVDASSDEEMYKKMANIVGCYKIREEVEKYQFAQTVIYKGFDITTCDNVLMKVYNISNKFCKNTGFMGCTAKKKHIENEIRILAEVCQHKNIIQYVDMVECNEYVCIVMEFVENVTLRSILDSAEISMSPKFICRYLVQVLDALEFLHETHNIAHRNIKAKNLYLTTGCVIKLGGFAAAIYVSEYDCDNDEIMDNILIKAPFWSSPELVEKKEKISTLTDIWSVGCLTIELLTGNQPYHDLKSMNAQNCIIKDKMPPIPSGNQTFIDFITKCFNKNALFRTSANKLKSHPFLTPSYSSNSVNKITKSTSKSPILNNINEEGVYKNLKIVRNKADIKSKCNDCSFDFDKMILSNTYTGSNKISICICGSNLLRTNECKKAFVCHQCFKVISKNHELFVCANNECNFRKYGYKLCIACNDTLLFDVIEKEKINFRILKRIKMSLSSFSLLCDSVLRAELNSNKNGKQINQCIEGFIYFELYICNISKHFSTNISDIGDLCDVREQFEQIKIRISEKVAHCLCGKFVKLTRLSSFHLVCCNCFTKLNKNIGYMCSTQCKYKYFVCIPCSNDVELIHNIDNDIQSKVYSRCQYSLKLIQDAMYELDNFEQIMFSFNELLLFIEKLKIFMDCNDYKSLIKQTNQQMMFIMR